ncbi:alanyl-tRNA synthetase [Carbonactinospora thermoautotrophica]|uniref:Alanine--tRNA ligase n=3 Tax=Carbonactinospora thermoautotrophica TaxID=1469144 RepID=A0A132N5F7_9ACTN|nr:alanine--tRNA ligase [Carbonactinospora thermoautotrophica]KWX00673.1 Alanine--tRNA ligase [Carbonactinospora thermoautotrophica]KWX05333.1 alanyl-tRNA synthetase [Carbonactinospora thermoautotrophica]
MESAEIRSRWLRFFEERGHVVVPSASLIADDPTLLLVNAGMVPFKPYFLGQLPPPWPRATSVQKCVRTVDIDEVGKTTRHASFFQMCGNFSFGDYFKETAIPLAWELVTRPTSEGGFGFPEDRLWVTIYVDDDEAFDIWHRQVGLPAERIQRRGMEDNFWSMGVPGPCGPCSEIYYDRGPEYGREGGPVVDEERYLEFWNLVFMQYERGEGGAKKDYPIIRELPKKNIDTGLGLERLAALLQGVDNIYEIDTTRKILDRASELTGAKYGADPRADVSLRVIADHVRTAVMLIGDGVMPGNEGRGYVLRRIMRRVVRNMRLLGAHDPTMHEMVAVTIEAMGPQYPELVTDAQRIDAVATAEEATFLQTLRTGTQIFDLAVAETKKAGRTVLSGDKAFQLHDTYGFPIDLTLEMAAEQGLKVDEEGFRRLMAEQRERAKADARAKKTGHVDVSQYREILDDSGASTFTGYDEVVSEGIVRGLIVAGSAARAAHEGEDVELVLDRTPFYAEGGGQLADTGVIRLANGAEVEVYDVQSPLSGLIVHKAKVRSGEVTVGLGAEAVVDVERRRAISRSHSATHLTHQALRDALGPTAAQAGSENSPGRFRFDFNSPSAVPQSVLAEVEEKINDLVAAELEVWAEIMSIEEAIRSGAIAMFGEKYGDRVRVVSIGDYSRELCGGTHVRRSSQLGLVKLLGESSIGAGVRRVEALVGTDAYRFLAREHVLVSQLSDALKARPEELPERVSTIVSRLREAEKEIERMRAAQLLQTAGELVRGARDVHGVSVVTHQAPDGTTADELRKLALGVRGRFPVDRGALVAVAAIANGRPVIVVAVNDAARERGLKAGELVRACAKILGGGGGGKDDVAQGGGTNASAIGEALTQVENLVAQRVTS